VRKGTAQYYIKVVYYNTVLQYFIIVLNSSTTFQYGTVQYYITVQ